MTDLNLEYEVATRACARAHEALIEAAGLTWVAGRLVADDGDTIAGGRLVDRAAARVGRDRAISLVADYAAAQKAVAAVVAKERARRDDLARARIGCA